MSSNKPATPSPSSGRAVDDEDPNYSPMTDQPAQEDKSADQVKEQVRKDNDRITKGAP